MLTCSKHLMMLSFSQTNVQRFLEIIAKILKKRGYVCADERERADHNKHNKQNDQAIFYQTLTLLIHKETFHRPASSSLEFPVSISPTC
jgi:hypothetical protein